MAQIILNLKIQLKKKLALEMSFFFLDNKTLPVNISKVLLTVTFICAAAQQNQQNDKCSQRRLRSAWASESLPGIQWVAQHPSFFQTDSEVFDQIGRTPRLI